MKRIFLTPEIIAEIKADACSKIDTMLSNVRGAGAGPVKLEYKPGDIELDEPIILNYTGLAWAKQTEIMRECDSEIAWHGFVRASDDRKMFEIFDIDVYPQSVTGVTVTTDEAKYEAWKAKMPNARFNSMRMQAHSHVNMGITPSGTDRDMYSKFLSHLGNESFYIFLILNKKNLAHIEIYDLKNNAIYDNSDVLITIEGEDVEDWYAGVFKDNVSKGTYRYQGNNVTTATGAAAAGVTYPQGYTPQTHRPIQGFYDYYEDELYGRGGTGRGKGKGGRK